MPRERLSPAQIERYQAHLTLPGVGAEGQRRLLGARVLLIGLGGLGCPVAQYLTAAGVGAISAVDDDIVDGTNLQRQVLYGESDRGRYKVEVAGERLQAMRPDLEFTPHQCRVTASNVRELVRGHDAVIDGSDNFATRYVVNDACVLESTALVSGSLYQYEGQVTVIRPPATPCYRCLFPDPPSEQLACQEVGVLGPLAGTVGAVQATEVVHLLVSGTSPLMGRMLLIDSRQASFRSVELRNDPACPLCGSEPSILEPTAVTAHVPGR